MILKIIIALVLSNVLGFIWYGPLFGKVWGRIIGCDPDEMKNNPEMKKGMWKFYVTNLFLSLVSIFALSMLIKMTGVVDIGATIQLAFLIAIGIIVPLQGGFALWSGKPKRLAWEMFWIGSGYQVILFIVYAIVLGM